MVSASVATNSSQSSCPCFSLVPEEMSKARFLNSSCVSSKSSQGLKTGDERESCSPQLVGVIDFTYQEPTDKNALMARPALTDQVRG